MDVSQKMKTRILISIFIGVLLSGCAERVAHQSKDTASKARWYKNQEGLIVSGIQPNDYIMKTVSHGDTSTATMMLRYPEGNIHDPLEDYPEFRAAFEDASKIADQATNPYKGKLGAVHVYWGTKKRVLREKYGIDWKTPSELNPNTNYD